MPLLWKYKNISFSYLSGNIFFSPYSLQVILAMVYAGAGGNTSKQLQQHLKFPDDKKALEEAVKGLLSTFGNNKDVTLSTANGMYVQRDFELKPAFAKTITEAYKSEVKNLDFSDSPGAAKEINGYVNTNTMGKIKKLYEDSKFWSGLNFMSLNWELFLGILTSIDFSFYRCILCLDQISSCQYNLLQRCLET